MCICMCIYIYIHIVSISCAPASPPSAPPRPRRARRGRRRQPGGPELLFPVLVSIAKGGVLNRNRNVVEAIGTETFMQTRHRVQAAGPAWALGPEDRSDVETKIPSHVEIESIEPRPTL